MKPSILFISLPLILSTACGREHGLRTLRHKDAKQQAQQQMQTDRNLTGSNDFSLLFPTENVNVKPVVRNTGNSCSDDQRKVKIEILTDNYGWETSWFFRHNVTKSRLAENPDSAYLAQQSITEVFCADIGFYEFIIKDKFEDGLCCGNGNGYYKISIRNPAGGWKKVVQGDKFGASMTHVIDVGQTESTMTERDALYLEAHNWRREDWHGRYNKEYIPLKWSQGLKDSAMEYAVALLDTCLTTNSPKHDPRNPFGENLARNKGTGSWGQLYHPEKIVGRFIDREEGLPWSLNGHLTNALWRATRYVGCAEAVSEYTTYAANGNEKKNLCRTQVCRYSKPGNCNMGIYRNADNSIDWLTPMLLDDSPCDPVCPPEGCYD